MNLTQLPETDQESVSQITDALAKTTVSFKRRVVERLVVAALGSIPWVGGFIGAAASLKIEQRGIARDSLQSRWLAEHARKMESLSQTLADLASQLGSLGPQLEERLSSESYLSLVRSAFRAWDAAETEEKRQLVASLLVRSAGARLCADDVVHLFIDWLGQYHETHFAVIREVFSHPGATRKGIWLSLYGSPAREDSAEADLYRLLIRDLSAGGVIRQERNTTAEGRFMRKRGGAAGHDRDGPDQVLLESAFEDAKPYVLTGLGRQFVYYTMGGDAAALSAELQLDGIRQQSHAGGV